MSNKKNHDNKKEITEALIKRALATRGLKWFIDYTYKEIRGYDYIYGEWHKKFFDALDRIEQGKLKRLIVEVCPGSGKTEIISKFFPAYFLGKHPEKKVACISYGDDLANDASRESRMIVQEPIYKDIFPDFVMSKDKAEARDWETHKRGRYYSVGIGGALTGKRYNLGIIDDYNKNRETAESEVERTKLWNFYTSTFFTRKFDENAAIIVVATRWHPYDLIGLLKEAEKENGDKWEVITLPALNEKDESFFPERFSSEYYKQERNVVGVRDFAALYMQDPIGSAGTLFKMEDFRYFAMSDLDPKDFTFSIHVDPAFSTRQESDDTAMMAIARHKKTKELYVIDACCETMHPMASYSYILSLADKWKAAGWQIDFISVEDVSLSRAQQEFIKGFELRMKDEGRFYTIIPFRPAGRGKKEDRIKFALEPILNRHALHFRNDDKYNPSWRKMKEQILQFPACKKFDVIDVLAQGCSIWSERYSNTGKTTEIMRNVLKKFQNPNKNKNVASVGWKSFY
jgi:hypothetical protein